MRALSLIQEQRILSPLPLAYPVEEDWYIELQHHLLVFDALNWRRILEERRLASVPNDSPDKLLDHWTYMRVLAPKKPRIRQLLAQRDMRLLPALNRVLSLMTEGVPDG
ncbi:hypothetical protein JCM8547_007433 [Rhodosporidiobolus lusitaniae]